MEGKLFNRDIYIAVFTIAFILTGFTSALNGSDELDRYISENNKIKTLHARFEQIKHLSIMESDHLSCGYIKFKRDRKLIWALENPYSYKFIINGKKIIRDYPQLNEREEYNIDENLQLKALFENIFMLMGLIGKNEIKETYFVSIKENNTIALIPKNPQFKKYISEIILKLNNKYLVSSIKLIEPSGDYTLIMFSDIETNIDINDSEFGLN